MSCKVESQKRAQDREMEAGFVAEWEQLHEYVKLRECKCRGRERKREREWRVRHEPVCCSTTNARPISLLHSIVFQ